MTICYWHRGEQVLMSFARLQSRWPHQISMRDAQPGSGDELPTWNKVSYRLNALWLRPLLGVAASGGLFAEPLRSEARSSQNVCRRWKIVGGVIIKWRIVKADRESSSSERQTSGCSLHGVEKARKNIVVCKLKKDGTTDLQYGTIMEGLHLVNGSEMLRAGSIGYGYLSSFSLFLPL